MRLLRLLLLLVLVAGLLPACNTVNLATAWATGRIGFSEAQLQRFLDRRYPRDFDRLNGLVTITLSNPHVVIPADGHRLRLSFDMGMGALGSRGSRGGHVTLVTGLRYVPGTGALYCDQPTLERFDLPGTGSLLGMGTRGIVNALVEDFARREPIYRMDDDLLKHLPAGKMIGAVTIEHGKVVVRLTDAPPR
jgi:hypothetical protein